MCSNKPDNSANQWQPMTFVTATAYRKPNVDQSTDLSGDRRRERMDLQESGHRGEKLYPRLPCGRQAFISCEAGPTQDMLAYCASYTVPFPAPMNQVSEIVFSSNCSGHGPGRSFNHPRADRFHSCPRSKRPPRFAPGGRQTPRIRSTRWSQQTARRVDLQRKSKIRPSVGKFALAQVGSMTLALSTVNGP